MSGEPLIGVIGDDATGTLAMTGALADSLSLHAHFLTRPEEISMSGIVGIDTRTRGVEDPSAAFSRVKATAESLGRRRPQLMVKRFDSALRGHIASEARGVIEAGYRPLLSTGSYLGLGRVMTEGQIRQAGRAVTSLPATRDSATRSTTASMQTMFASAGLSAKLLSLDVVRSRDRLATALEEDADVLMFDAETVSDVVRVGSEARGRRYGVLACDPLVAVHVALSRMRSESSVATICIVGTPHRQVREQIQFVSEVDQEVALVDLAGDGLDEVLSRVTAASEAGRDVVVHTGREMVGPDHAARIDALARALGQASTMRSLVIVGGETTRSVLEGLNVRSIAPQARWATGECYSIATTKSGRTLRVVTRSGGAGREESLLVLLWRLNRLVAAHTVAATPPPPPRALVSGCSGTQRC